MELKQIMMVGAGAMGSGITQVAAEAGYQVLLWTRPTSVAGPKAIATATKNLNRKVEKGKLTAEERDAVLARITHTVNLEDAKNADLIIEAVAEDIEIKKDIFSKLDKICKPECIFATNTSSIPISQVAAIVDRADKFIGMHFFNPVPVMKLVELIRGIKTSDETIEVAESFVAKIGKTSVRVKDVPGFLVNRINNALRQEAYRCMEEGVASIEDIDKAMKMGLNHPMGPFEVADFAGLDIGYSLINQLYEGYKDSKWAPNLTLQKLVLAGDLGRKTGKGWYDYTSGEKKVRTDIKF
ncbi:MAG: 3-hydroxyacyl-CoA dehydrogenase family protein [Syntrophomonadaceae bacterium]